MELLAKLGKKLDNTLPALLIGNIITSHLTNSPTPLQLGLAVLIEHSKELLKAYHDFGITCSYDELRRYKRSTTSAASKESELAGIKISENGLVQSVGDNFDQDISSQNGKIQTHSMALLLTQQDFIASLDNDQRELVKIPRLKNSELGSEIQYELEIIRYTGPKKPDPPAVSVKVKVMPLKVLARMVLAKGRAAEKDYPFLRDVVEKADSPEYNGYNTEATRSEGQSLQPITRAVYLPLIDLPPAKHDIMLTSMLKVKWLTEKTGQTFTLFTLDQQLYKIAVEVLWSLPELFPKNFIIRLGGMHLLMSFIGAVGNLMMERSD